MAALQEDGGACDGAKRNRSPRSHAHRRLRLPTLHGDYEAQQLPQEIFQLNEARRLSDNRLTQKRNAHAWLREQRAHAADLCAHGAQDGPQNGARAGLDGRALRASELHGPRQGEEGAGEADLALLAGLRAGSRQSARRKRKLPPEGAPDRGRTQVRRHGGRSFEAEEGWRVEEPRQPLALSGWTVAARGKAKADSLRE